ncbi:prenyltransferase/squalene oxidase repeat-containing protein [Spirosoma endophyticum]|uniref:Heparinase II/III-like protein n=1 Tax=Spirosoma endophyticum TaxID=662367 RepID=A0A1I1ESC4_9BACT|nr:hypothetical protein [Spirosoma endophyticum]SFB89556.1 hypothetical protein SAMN05216167_10137 [Spirosoma endophyticum]
MENISRKAFLQYAGLATMATLTPFLANAWAGKTTDDDFYKKIVAANADEVSKLVKALASDITDVKRRSGYDLANLVAAFSEPTSTYFQKAELVPFMTKIIRFLVKAQHDDGTLDFGNLASPPDTAFILEPLCAAGTILKTNTNSSLDEVKTLLKQFVVKAGEGLRTGGVHTPNHRWVVSAALAKINALYPNPGYVKRIREWLSEGVFCDNDGNFLERSMNYSAVIDRALVTMGRLLPMPSLFESARKNLWLVYYHAEPNGELVTVDSRRQDQYAPISILNFYHDYYFLAIHDNNPEFAAIANYIETLPGFEARVLTDLLVTFLEEPLFKKALPSPKAPPATFEKFFKTTNLVRIRRDTTTTTIFGGNDFPIIIASGRSNSPNFFAYRKGEAILKYMRLSTDFFSTGYFHSQGITQAGGKYVLHQKFAAPYYQPLPAKYKRADGNYQLAPSTDGRFWNKMDFEHRPQSNVSVLDTTITVEEKNGSNQLTFSVKGIAGVHVTIEFCFREGGSLSGLKKLDELPDTYALESGSGEYSHGKDSIKFGPGIFKHAKLQGLEGEMYSSHFGSLRTTGMHVYFTGLTPFTHTISIG